MERYVYLLCNSGTVCDLFWQYWTTSENNNAKQLRETSPFPRLKGLSNILDLFRLVKLIFYLFFIKKYRKLMSVYLYRLGCLLLICQTKCHVDILILVKTEVY